MILQMFRTRRGRMCLAIQTAFLMISGRLVYIQAAQHPSLAAMARGIEHKEVRTEAQRAAILDRRGHPLALTVRVPTVIVNPRTVLDEERATVAEKLAGALKMSVGDVEESLSRESYFAYIKRKVSEREAEAVKKLGLRGVDFCQEGQRIYPNGRMLCHTLGIVGMDGEGLEGLERRFNNLLAGTNGREAVMRDALGRVIAISGESAQQAVDGKSLVLTIDMRIQRIVEEELDVACAKYRPESACAVAMDPWTGDVLALACWPTFDPAQYKNVSNRRRANFSVESCVEPGSSFKPFVAAAALEHGLVAANTIFDCHQGAYRIGGRTLHDAHGYGRLTLADVLVFSSNIGMAQVGALLGPQRMYDTLCAFGFGRPTGIEIPGESSGILHHPKTWSRLTISSVSMGQEVAVTPLQLTAGFCVFANGGFYVRPRIVLGSADTDGRNIVKNAERPQARRVLSPVTATLMRDILAGVVERGTARSSAIKGYSMGGKTGTAQVAREDGRGYETGAYTSVFVGMAPIEKPRIVICLMAKKPSGGAYYGGTVAAPAVSHMIEKVLSMRGFPRASNQFATAAAKPRRIQRR